MMGNSTIAYLKLEASRFFETIFKPLLNANNPTSLAKPFLQLMQA